MTIIIPPGYGTCAWAFECIGRPRNYAITCGFKPDVAITNPATMATLLSNAMVAPGAPCGDPANMLNSYRYLGTTVSFMTGTGPVPGIHSTTVTGTASPGGMPPNAAYLVRKQTNRGGRQGRGRMYAPPFNLSELSVDSAGFLAGGTITSLETQWRTWLLSAHDDDVPLFLLHGPPKVGTVPAPDEIQQVFIESQVATQKRRLRK